MEGGCANLLFLIEKKRNTARGGISIFGGVYLTDEEVRVLVHAAKRREGAPQGEKKNAKKEKRIDVNDQRGEGTTV